MAKDWDDGPDDETEPLLTQRELPDVQIGWYERLNIVVGAALTHLRALRAEIELRPAGKVVKLQTKRPDSDAIAACASGAVHSEAQGAATLAVAASGSITPRGDVTLKAIRGTGGSGSDEPPTFGRMPSSAEFVSSGAIESGGRFWWEHHDYQLKDGSWGAGIVGYQADRDSLVATQVFPRPEDQYFATRPEARAMNVRLGRWFCTVNAPSPSSPPVAGSR